MIKELRKGTRFDAEVRLVKVTPYDCLYAGEHVTRWRHVFMTDGNEAIVYTGNEQIARRLQSRYKMRATVKEHEERFRCTRVLRPVVTLILGEQGSLALPVKKR